MHRRAHVRRAVDALFDSMDLDRSGNVDFEEFVRAVNPKFRRAKSQMLREGASGATKQPASRLCCPRAPPAPRLPCSLPGSFGAVNYGDLSQLRHSQEGLGLGDEPLSMPTPPGPALSVGFAVAPIGLVSASSTPFVSPFASPRARPYPRQRVVCDPPPSMQGDEMVSTARLLGVSPRGAASQCSSPRHKNSSRHRQEAGGPVGGGEAGERGGCCRRPLALRGRGRRLR